MNHVVGPGGSGAKSGSAHEQPGLHELKSKTHSVHCPNGPRSHPQPFSLHSTGAVPLPESDDELLADELLEDELLEDELLDDELLDDFDDPYVGGIRLRRLS